MPPLRSNILVFSCWEGSISNGNGTVGAAPDCDGVLASHLFEQTIFEDGAVVVEFLLLFLCANTRVFATLFSYQYKQQS